MQQLKEKVKKSVNLIILLCHIQKISVPEIYFIKSGPGQDFVLYDSTLNIISYDRRDVGSDVSSLKYVFKENALYINLDIMKNTREIPVYICRAARGIYQCNQAYRYENGITDTNEAREFHFCYYLCQQKKNTLYSPQNTVAEIDKNAFTAVMLECLYGKSISFPEAETKMLNDRIFEIKKQYSQKYINQFIKRRTL